MHKWKKYVEKFLWQAAKSVENLLSLLVACVENLMSQTVCFPTVLCEYIVLTCLLQTQCQNTLGRLVALIPAGWPTLI